MKQKGWVPQSAIVISQLAVSEVLMSHFHSTGSTALAYLIGIMHHSTRLWYQAKSNPSTLEKEPRLTVVRATITSTALLILGTWPEFVNILTRDQKA